MLPAPPRKLLGMFVLLSVIPSAVTASIIWSLFPGSLHTPNAGLVVQDFIVMWVSGKIALAGDIQAFASQQAYNDWIGRLLGPGIDTYYWLYAPHLVLLAIPLSFFSILTAWAVWTVGTSMLLWSTIRHLGLRLWSIVAIFLSPAFLEDVIDGQNGALLSGAMVGSLAFAQTRPILSGAFLSILTLKPQMALVVPVCMLAARHFKPLFWAAFFSALWIGGSFIVLGEQAWIDYVVHIMPAAKALHLELVSVKFGTLALQNLVVTPFGAVRGLGFAPSSAYVVQMIFTIMALLAAAWLWWPRANVIDVNLRIAASLALVPVATPYAMNYDMICASVAISVLIADSVRQGVIPRSLAYAAAITWLWPGISFTFGTSVRIAGMGAFAYLAFAISAILYIQRNIKKISA